MANNIAIRLGVEGQADVRRSLDDLGTAGQAAFRKVGEAADGAGAATDRQAARLQRLAQAAREAEAQARAQANVNALLGVGTGSAGSARDSASTFEEALNRQDKIQEARRAQAAQTAQASINQLLGIRDAQVGAARSSAAAFEEAFQQEAAALKRTADLRAATIRNASTGWRELSATGSAQLANIDAGRRLAAMGMTPGANENAPGRRLRSDEVTNLIYQGGDVASQLGSGSPLGMIAMQQGPQIAQVFAGPGGASVKGAFAQAGEAASSLVSRIGLVGGAVGAVTAVVLTGAAAFATYSSQQRNIALSVSGAGRASGATVGAINAVALANAAQSGLSVSTARDMAAEFAATGRIGTEMYDKLLGSARDYAATTRQELPEATAALAQAFADPAKGAETLNAQLGFLDATTKETIERLAAQGDRLGAQKALFDAFSGSLVNANQRLGFFSRQWQEFRTNTSNEFDAIGRFVDRGLGGGALEERLSTLKGQLDFRQRNMGRAGGLFDGLLGFDMDAIRKDIAEVQAEIAKAAASGTKSAAAQRSLEVGQMLRGLNPEKEAMEQLEKKAANFNKAITLDGVPDPLGNIRRAVDYITAQVKQMREDMAAGGAAFADATRQAQFGQRTVGFTPQGLSAAQIEETAANRRIEAQRTQSNNPDLDQYANQLASIERDRRTQIETLTRQATISENAVGGAFSRMPPEVQRQILGLSGSYGRIPAGIIAGIATPESGGNLDIGFSRALGEDGRRSSAYGLGQITRGTAEDAIRRGYLPQGFDRTNRETMAEGIAGVLSMKLDDNGGDLNKAIMAYRGSSSDATNRAYLMQVLRGAGLAGDASQLGVARDEDNNRRQLGVANDNVKNLTENYGRNALQLEATSRATEMLAQLQARGVTVTDELRASVMKFAQDGATAAQRMKMVQFLGDSSFEREQLGRDSIDQAAYARARQVVGDTTSPAAQTVIETARMNENLRVTRSLTTEAFSGMLSDLRQGAGFMTAIGNAANRLADRLLSMAADRSIAAIFGALTGGNSGGALASLFGGSSSGASGVNVGVQGWMPTFDLGGYTGAGPRLQPAGVVHAGEIVWSQSDIRRAGGVSVVEAMRLGVRGYDEGGLVARESFARGMRASGGAANESGGSSGAPIIINATGEPVQTKRVQTPMGPRDSIIIGKGMAEQILSSPDVAKALAQGYGLRRVGR